MTISLGNDKRIALLAAHANKAKAITDEYFEKEIYTITCADSVTKKEKYRYNVPQMLEKYGIRSNVELIFLVSQAGECLGVCEFCNWQIFKYSTRSSQDKKTCECIGRCDQCLKPFESGYGSNGKCNGCHCKNRPVSENWSAPVYSSRSQYDQEYSFEDKYEGCMDHWSAKDILEDINAEELEAILAKAKLRIKFLTKLLAVAGE